MVTQTQPNIVLVHCHNLGRYLGCYGRPVETPNIDALAAESRQFEEMYCSAPHCSPARGSLWTGRYPHRNGLVGLSHLGWSLNNDEQPLPHHLTDLGYDTRLIGLQHVAENASDLGFQHVDGSQHEFSVEEPARDVADRAADFFESDAAQDEQPFFASVGFSEVHRQPLVDRCLDCGWTFDLPDYESEDPDDVEVSGVPWLPDRAGVREDLAAFHGMIGAVDEAVGTIVESLDESGLAKDTLLLFTTDHGIGFPRAMGTLYDPGVETFLLSRWPDIIEPGTDDHLLSGVDLFPTLLEIAGGEPASDIDGRSFRPLLTGNGSYEPRDRIFCEFTWHSKYTPMRAVRTRRYKYIRNFGDLPEVYIPAPLFTAPSGLAVREEYYANQRPQEELYDLEADPLEQENLVEDSSHEETLSRLRGEVQSWMERTDDRLLEGPWPPTAAQEERVWKAPWVPEQVGH